LVIAMNFHPSRSFTDYRIPSAPGTYRTVLDTDRPEYGGFSRQAAEVSHHAMPDRIERHFLSLYLPSRTALVLAPAARTEP
ncbi:MAG: 1,4-alpha-glucan-branching enzyme, partial [Myxococcales bacterium]|nr:1,4-alpha-glucan-branching enzyme [Myxococcales bacterium]